MLPLDEKAQVGFFFEGQCFSLAMNYSIIADCGKSGPVVVYTDIMDSNIHHSMSTLKSLLSSLAYPYDLSSICVRGQSYKDTMYA